MPIFLIRHAETDWNEEGRIQGDLDIPLNSKGLDQAKQLQKRFKSIQFDSIFSSDLKRAIQTAEFLPKSSEIPIITDDRLRERDYGIWKELTWDEVRLKFPEEYRNVRMNPVTASPPHGENLQEVSDRVLQFFSEIEEFKNQNTAIVSHNSPLMIIIAHLKGLELDEIRKVPYLSNTEIIQLDLVKKSNKCEIFWNVSRAESAPLAFREKIV